MRCNTQHEEYRDAKRHAKRDMQCDSCVAGCQLNGELPFELFAHEAAQSLHEDEFQNVHLCQAPKRFIPAVNRQNCMGLLSVCWGLVEGKCGPPRKARVRS